MDKLLVQDTSLPEDLTTTGIHDAVKAQKPTLTRCCSIPQQLSSLPGKLGSCTGVQSTPLPGLEEPKVVIGTGVYFQNFPSSPNLDPNGDTSELRNLFKLATIACEVSESSIPYRQLVKKRRTPRKILWINGSSRITNGNWKSRNLAAGAPEVTKRQRIENRTPGLYTPPPWVANSVHDTSICTSKRNCTSIRNSSNTVILKFGSQNCPVGKKIMAFQSKASRIKFNKVSKGNNKVPSVSSKPCARRMPDKDTRVQGVAKRILQFVGDGSTAEKFIRGAFGNNPDTSKALRLLLTQHKVYRIGDGGRGKAFLYVATPAGLRELEELKDHDAITTDNSAIPQRPDHCQDGLQTSLKDRVSLSNKAHDGLLGPRSALRDVSNCLPEPKLSRHVLLSILGTNKE